MQSFSQLTFTTVCQQLSRRFSKGLSQQMERLLIPVRSRANQIKPAAQWTCSFYSLSLSLSNTVFLQLTAPSPADSGRFLSTCIPSSGTNLLLLTNRLRSCRSDQLASFDRSNWEFFTACRIDVRADIYGFKTRYFRCHGSITQQPLRVRKQFLSCVKQRQIAVFDKKRKKSVLFLYGSEMYLIRKVISCVP